MEFSAWGLAKAWNSVALASGEDKGRPALYRTVLVEQFAEGIRLIATDAYILLKAWVPCADYPDSPDPGPDEEPEDSMVCVDRDRRVTSLMNYAQNQTKSDGAATPLTMTMVLGTMRPGAQNQLAGMAQASVSFHFGNEYDERIETPIFDGAYPAWKGLWYAHEAHATTTVAFGANGFLRIGKLSALWDKAAIRFVMGGTLGVAKFYVDAPDVNVEGLAMPWSIPGAEPDVVAPSEEGVHAEYGEELDQFLAEILKTEVAPGADEALDAAKLAQLIKAGRICVAQGAGDIDLLVAQVGITAERASELLEDLVEIGVLTHLDDDKYTVAEDATAVLARLEGAAGDDGDGTEPV